MKTIYQITYANCTKTFAIVASMAEAVIAAQRCFGRFGDADIEERTVTTEQADRLLSI